jgi:hypothetical protein
MQVVCLALGQSCLGGGEAPWRAGGDAGRGGEALVVYWEGGALEGRSEGVAWRMM